MTKFIGDREIDKIEGALVTFKEEEGKPLTEEFSEKLLERIVTDEPLDASALRDLRCKDTAKEIIEVLLSNNVYLSEIEFALGLVVMSFNDNRLKVEDKLWGSDDRKQSVLQLDQHMKKFFN